jgi:hypothetical protein
MADVYFEINGVKRKLIDLGDGTYAEAVAQLIAGATANNIGTQANAWSAVTLAATASAPAAGLNIAGYSLLTISGQFSAVTGTWDLYLEVSQNGTDWIQGEKLEPGVSSATVGDGYFEHTVPCAAAYVRLKLKMTTAGGITVTATIAAKRQ